MAVDERDLTKTRSALVALKLASDASLRTATRERARLVVGPPACALVVWLAALPTFGLSVALAHSRSQ
jgi:hypothetical protein